ncbi:Hsp70 nucleotide exchange factor FES1-like protein [Drosera capensis]
MDTDTLQNFWTIEAHHKPGPNSTHVQIHTNFTSNRGNKRTARIQCERFLMGRIVVTLVLWQLFLMSAAIVIADEDHVNHTASAGLFWTAAKDESDLYRKTNADDSTLTLNGNNELDGGFSSLDGILQWAIGHSDPAKLKETAQNVQRTSPDELKKRQAELKELMEGLRMPSDAEMMKIAIDDLSNSSLSFSDRVRALEELLILVEPIDNANDLNKLGGLVAVIKELDNVEWEIRKLSAWVLGKASQNNPVVQDQVLQLGALKKLIMMVKSNFVEEATKALYAVSALIRNNFDGQRMFYAEAGDLMLQEILSNPSFDIRLRKKSVLLIGDLAEFQLENMDQAELPFFGNRVFLKSVVDLMASHDLDLQEKALVVLKNLLQLRTTQVEVLRDFCNLHTALDKMQSHLQQLMEDENQKGFAVDVETLRREVEQIFHQKLIKIQNK